MARNRFIKTRSNYVIKDLHQTTNIGNIYERDFMTISDLNSYAPGSLPAYGLNGFKMVVRDGINLKKKHHYGNWLKNDACGTKTMYWTLQCVDENDKSGNEVVLKPNLNSVLDFACYGSTSKMIESSVKDVINKYPGELFLTNMKVDINGTKMYIVDNPFNIEMDKIVLNDDVIDNPLRAFSISYEKYCIYTADESVSYTMSWDVSFLKQDPCRQDNELLSVVDLGYPFSDKKPKLLLFYYVFDGKKMLFHDGSYIGGRITPRSEVKKAFFDSLTYFSKLLLNRKTNYTAVLETPKETSNGNVMYKKAYTWPKTPFGNWNIDVTSVSFLTYFDSLLKIGEFYDNFFSDNLWRAMTHEAIINFDWTLTKIDNDGVVSEEDNPHSERLKGFIHVAGRQFDELKQYIDGIANSNAVTYNECQNKPDAFLADELTNYGWDVKLPLNQFLIRFATEALYPLHGDGYTAQDANYEFLRRLLLNSRAILAAKGTKRSIEMLMSMFGYYSLNFIEHANHEVMRDGVLKTLKWDDLTYEEQKSILTYSYDITEYVYVADANSPLWKEEGGESLDFRKAEEVKNINKYKINYDYENPDEYQGLPIKEVLVSTNNLPMSLRDFQKYLIPWFDRTLDYDADIYFESKGGWGLKQTTVGEFGDYNEVVIDTNERLKVYDESIKYLRFVDTIEDLLNVYGEYPENNDVYYVYDITKSEKYDWGYISIYDENGQQKSEPQHLMSHYFILKNVDYETTLGVVRDENGQVVFEDENASYNSENVVVGSTINDETGIPVKKYGWKNVSEDELTLGMSEDAKRVYYLESIIENNRGNNPHGGHGRYDEGNTYKRFFEDIFQGAKDNDSFIDISDNIIPQDKIYGFILNKQIDNVKCWYFTDTMSNDNTLEMLLGDDTEAYTNVGFQTASVGDGNFVRFTTTRGDDADDNYANEIFSSKQCPIMEPCNMEGGDINDEAAANSIINSKHLYIEFVPDVTSPGGMYDFIENSIMHYVKQVIPSTTILKYYVPKSGFNMNCLHRTYVQSAIINK